MLGGLLALLLMTPTAQADGLELLEPRAQAPYVAMSPRFELPLSDTYNHELGFAFATTVHPIPVLGIEAHVSLTPMFGVFNTADMPRAVLLFTPGDPLESLDRMVAVQVGAVFAPVAGWLAPPGLPPVRAEFLVGAGGGFEVGQVELLGLDAGSGDVVLQEVVGDHVRGGFFGMLGGRVHPDPLVGFRMDVRATAGGDRVPVWGDAASAADNRDNQITNRLQCADGTAICGPVPWASVSLEFGVEFRIGPGAE